MSFNDWPPFAPRLMREGQRSRREAERAIAFWQDRLQAMGGALTIAELDLHRAEDRDWANRFLISVDPVIERSALVLYGATFARLLQLPVQPRPDQPISRQLPRRYAELFLRGCSEMREQMAPVRLDGEADRSDGSREQYRVSFVPVGVKPNSLTCFAFGAFNSRTIEPRAAG